MSDYVPHSDPEFNLWQASLIAIVQPNVTVWGILPADSTALVASQLVWTNAFAKTSNPKNCTDADTQAKNDARRVYEKNLRNFIAQWLSHNAKVTDSDRTRMNITVKSNTRTSVGVPTTSPEGKIDFSVRNQHIISYSDSATPTSKAKPSGVHGCEIWRKVGAETSFVYVVTCTAAPYTAIYDEADAGKTATYHLRWVNTKGEQGPWGAAISALIVG